MSEAKCRNNDLTLEERWAIFFPHDNGYNGIEKTHEGKAMCKDCPVIRDCLEYALVNRLEHGTYGGTTGSYRQRNRQYLMRRFAA